MDELLRAALDSVDFGIVLYDPDDRLVFCNRNYRGQFPERFHGWLEPGNTFEALLRACAEDGFIVDARDQVDEYVERRLARHRRGAVCATDQASRDMRNSSALLMLCRPIWKKKTEGLQYQRAP